MEHRDPSHNLDMVTLFSSSNYDAEQEALLIHGVLEANGIPSSVVGSTGYPNFGFVVQVPLARVKEAEDAIQEARAAGPAAAAEAEADSESGE